MAYLGLRCAGAICHLNMNWSACQDVCRAWGAMSPALYFAEKVSLRGTDVYEYVRPFITGAPRDLQNGLYTLTFDGRVLSAQRRSGAWLSPIAV